MQAPPRQEQASLLAQWLLSSAYRQTFERKGGFSHTCSLLCSSSGNLEMCLWNITSYTDVFQIDLVQLISKSSWEEKESGEHSMSLFCVSSQSTLHPAFPPSFIPMLSCSLASESSSQTCDWQKHYKRKGILTEFRNPRLGGVCNARYVRVMCLFSGTVQLCQLPSSVIYHRVHSMGRCPQHRQGHWILSDPSVAPSLHKFQGPCLEGPPVVLFSSEHCLWLAYWVHLKILTDVKFFSTSPLVSCPPVHWWSQPREVVNGLWLLFLALLDADWQVSACILTICSLIQMPLLKIVLDVGHCARLREDDSDCFDQNFYCSGETPWP